MKKEIIDRRLRNKLKGKKVFITGGCGFIGSHIAEKLVELGATPVIFDNLYAGSLQNIKHIRKKCKVFADKQYDIRSKRKVCTE